MIAVAIAALILFGWTMMKHRATFLRLAADAARIEQYWRKTTIVTERDLSNAEQLADSTQISAEGDRRGAASTKGDRQFEENLADRDDGLAKSTRRLVELYRQLLSHGRERADFHGRLRKKYQRAALYPWLPVAPDPP